MSAQLASLQRWMHEVITHPDGVVAGATTNRAHAQFDEPPEWFDEVVTPSATLSAQQRLEIYQHGYFRRLLDTLAQLLPVLRHALGEDLFERFAVEYLAAHPSSSHTLAQLDEGFVRFLDENRPDRHAAPAEREWWLDFIVDLATLERRIRVVFDGPGAEGRALLSPAAVDHWTDERLLAATVQPVPCLQFATFRYPVRNHLLAVRRGEDPDPPAPAATRIVFNRRDYAVRLLEFDRTPFEFLQALAHGQAVAAAAAHADASEPTRPPAVRALMCQFAEAGLFLAPSDSLQGEPR